MAQCLFCGCAIKQASQARIRDGRGRYCSRSCSSKANAAHGHNTRTNGQSPTYVSWNKLRDRCRNPNNRHFEHYGGRGITVCPRWDKFENFLADMGERPDGTSIDRIDPDGNYEPGNCRWADQATQGANKRTAVWLNYKGERLCLEHLADKLGMASQTLECRIKAGWPESRWAAPSQVSPNHVSRRGARALPLDTEKCP